MRFLVDTDHISILQRGAGAEFAALSARIAAVDPGDLAFSVISFHEQSMGCHAYINQARTQADVIRGYRMLTRVIQGFAAAPVLPFDELAASTYEGLFARRLRVATMDLRISGSPDRRDRGFAGPDALDQERRRLRQGERIADRRLDRADSLTQARRDRRGSDPLKRQRAPVAATRAGAGLLSITRASTSRPSRSNER